jgi:hypothetical protein
MGEARTSMDSGFHILVELLPLDGEAGEGEKVI